MRVARQLVERPISFDYSYNMKCPACPGVTTITGEEYYNEARGAHVDCAHCGSDIHFGRDVMTIRDAGDAVLDDERARRFSWYHTSTEADWPSSSRPMPAPMVAHLARVLRPDAVAAARRTYESQALHLGTYEAAIESMLRRMRNQDDGGSLFYLYRVALRDGLVIEPGWRDENAKEAAQITQLGLGSVGAVRYLNVHEARGSISMAVRTSAVGSVQRLALPLQLTEDCLRAGLLAEVAGLRARIAEIDSTRSDDLSPLDRLGQEAACRRGLPFARSPSPEQNALQEKIDKIIADEFLRGVSPLVRGAFESALSDWYQAQGNTIDVAAYIRHFACMARTLTHSDEIIRMLDNQTVRRLQHTD